MKPQFERFQSMTQGIKDSGLSQPQADAIVNAVTVAVQDISVTPELLDDRFARQDRKFEGCISELREDLFGQLAEHKQEMRGQLAEHKQEMHGQLTEHKQEMRGLFDEHRREMARQFTEHKQEMRGQFTEHKHEMRALLTEHKNDTKLRFDAVDRRFENVDRRFDSIDTEIRKLHDIVQGSYRAQMRYFIGFMSITLAGALGVIGSILST